LLLICTVLFFFFFPYITIVVNLYSTGFCVYWFFSRYSTGYFFLSYITIVVNLYGTAHGKKKICFWFLCLQHIPIFIYIYIYIYIFFFLLLAFVFTGVFNLYSIGYFFFSYITIVVNLYGTAHGKNNQLYNYFCFWFLCLQHIPVFIYFFFFCFWFLCLLAGVFNLYSTSYFFSYITIVVNLYGTAHGKNN
jgi:hypothetical protein